MIKRRIYADLKEHIKKKEITFIVGPRQAGKTTLMLLLEQELKKSGEKTVFVNLDIENDRQYFDSQRSLIRKIELEIGKDGGFVFIDEIQRKENAGIFLKGIYDMNLPYKFIVSGSGSVELKEKIHESLSGRKRIFELPTINFEEFINYKTGYKYESRLNEFFKLEKIRIREFLEDYLKFGGYPRVVMEDTVLEKRKIMGELYQSYLEKDIAFLLGIRKTEDFTVLVRVMASQIGNLVNITELSSTIGVSAATIKNYLWYLQKTFLLIRLTPYFKNIRKEISKSPVFYFYDLGMRSYARGTFGLTSQAIEVGPVFENFVFNILRDKVRDTSFRILFWRTKDGAEVDFVVDKGSEVIPIEVKYKTLKKPEISRSLLSFIDKYRPKIVCLIHLGDYLEKTVKGSRIQFIPYHQFLSSDL